MRDRAIRLEPQFGGGFVASDDGDDDAASSSRKAGRRAQRSLTRRILPRAGTLATMIVGSAVTAAFLVNALMLQKGMRTTLLTGWPSAMAEAVRLGSGTPAPPRRPETLDLAPAAPLPPVRAALVTPPSNEAPPQPLTQAPLVGEAPSTRLTPPLPVPMTVAAPVEISSALTLPQRGAAPLQTAKALIIADGTAEGLGGATQPSPQLLPQAVPLPPARPAAATVVAAADPHDQAARLLMPQAGDRDLAAVGRALNRLGLGPVVPNGVKSLELRAAIVKFQRLNHLPVTGETDPAVIAALKADAGAGLR